MAVTGIILAGGNSSRMGTDKGMQLLCGKPLISYAISALAPLCDNILISSSSNEYQSFRYRVIPDAIKGIGPMGGLYSAMLQSQTDDNLVLSCDLPFVTEELLAYILQNSFGYQVAIPWMGNLHYEPLCGFYSLSVLNEIKRFVQKGNYKLPDLFEEIHINRLVISSDLDCYSEELFFNVNSKHDLKTAETLMSSRK
jgi:molybdenum cofactor guanylyltransferase